jgi:glycolate oxidase iron-sulfur subunit
MASVRPADEGTDPLRALTDACVHCGFCLPACPTYQLDGEEAESPRGRIHLLRQLLEGEAGPGPVLRHLDNCLGCLACVPACPSGVAYDQIVTVARERVEPARGVADRLRRAGIFALFPHPRRLAVLRGPLRLLGPVARRVPPRLLPPTVRAMNRLLPPVLPRPRVAGLHPPAGDARPRAVVGLLTGCVQSAFFAHVSAAVIRVLTAEGCAVVVPPGQGCCGALDHHNGRLAQARQRARATIAAFDEAGVDVVVTDVAGCGSTMKEYAELLAGDALWAQRAEAFAARVRDITEFLATLDPIAPRHPLPVTVAYHDACHLAHGQGVRDAPRRLLRGIPQLRLVPIPPGEAEVCCGSAGVYNLLRPAQAGQLGARKAAALRDTGAQVVAAGNPGCLLQLRAALADDEGPPLATLHTIELLDASLAGTSPQAVLA